MVYFLTLVCSFFRIPREKKKKERKSPVKNWGFQESPQDSDLLCLWWGSGIRMSTCSQGCSWSSRQLLEGGGSRFSVLDACFINTHLINRVSLDVTLKDFPLVALVRSRVLEFSLLWQKPHKIYHLNYF